MSTKLKRATIYVGVGLFVVVTTLVILCLNFPERDIFTNLAGTLILFTPIEFVVFAILAACAEHFLSGWIGEP